MESAFRGMGTRFLLAFVVLALCVGAFAQGGTSELSGLVTDPTGAVVSGASVKLTNSSTGEVRTTTTTSCRHLSFPGVAGGRNLYAGSGSEGIQVGKSSEHRDERWHDHEPRRQAGGRPDDGTGYR